MARCLALLTSNGPWPRTQQSVHSALVLLFFLHCILTSSGNEDGGRGDAHQPLRNEGHPAADLSPRIERLRQWRLNQVLLDAQDKTEESVHVQHDSLELDGWNRQN